MLTLIVLFAGSSFNAKAQQVNVSVNMFYNELSPYGSWFNHDSYGYVWLPNVDRDFTPYLTNGYWTVTQYGNTWVSDYEWGWAPFHYGRWYYDDFYGWLWIPDTTWAPAWVVWRNGGGYYGWAPMMPGINFSFSVGYYNNIPNFYWSFVPNRYAWDRFVYRHCAPRYQNVTIVNQTTYVTNYYRESNYHYYTGPSHEEIRRTTNQVVKVHRFEDDNRPGRGHIDNDRIKMYRPSLVKGDNRLDLIKGQGNNGSNPRPGSDNGNGGNGNNGGNNGHGNGDQDAPGNSGGNNNGENSENGGQGNSGHGKGNPERQDGRMGSMYSNDVRSEMNRMERQSPNRQSSWSNERVQSQNREHNIPDRTPAWNGNRSSNQPQNMPSRSSQWNERSTNQRVTTPSPSNGSRGNTSMNRPSGNSRSSISMPSRSSSRETISMNSPSRSSSSGRSFTTPSRSSGSKGSFSSPRQSGGSKSIIPRKK